MSNAEQRAARLGEKSGTARIGDLYAALPAITGKLELEYEGELKGADTIARELIRAGVGRVFSKHVGEVSFQPVVQWFEMGGELKLAELGAGPPSGISSFPEFRACSNTLAGWESPIGKHRGGCGRCGNDSRRFMGASTSKPQ